ncbi:MAG TPA: helix-turn-helix domain-containing protein [Actinomycetota bacterium]|nr:helix-turn-helix domain-containing protein [Actinomycetota bacterium]
MQEDRLLSLPEVARYLGISRSGAYLLAKSGRLPSVQIARRIVRVRPEDLEAFILQHRRGKDEEGAQ